MITKELKHFLQVTTELSQFKIPGGSFGAIIVKNGIIIGTSENFILKEVDPCAHSEVLAVRDACRTLKSLDLSGCHLFTLTEPCPMCMAAIYWSQVSSITYPEKKLDAQDQITFDRKSIKTLVLSANKTLTSLEQDYLLNSQNYIFVQD
jgi:tRNA(Arg) A34 adenosine deaminase TadA